MLKNHVNYIDYIKLEHLLQKYKDINLNIVKESKHFTNIVGVGQLGKYFIEYCKCNDRWNKDNLNFAKSCKESNNDRKIKYLNSFLLSELDEYMLEEHNNGDLNVFLYNLSELGEFDKFINRLMEVKNSFNIILGVKTKYSKLQFDVIVDKLSKDTKLPVVVIDEEKLIKETNNYIIYELYNFARGCIEV